VFSFRIDSDSEWAIGIKQVKFGIEVDNTYIYKFFIKSCFQVNMYTYLNTFTKSVCKN
jgi:hypothetical protein